MKVQVLDFYGREIMPTERFGHVRKLLKNHKANVVQKTPFTIQLMYHSTTYKQNNQDQLCCFDPKTIQSVIDMSNTDDSVLALCKNYERRFLKMAKTNDRIVTQIIDDLINVCHGEKTFEHFGRKWGFRTINSQEYLDALQLIANENGDAARVYAMQIDILRKSLVSIDGVMISDDDKDKLLSNVTPTIVNVLYQDFEDMRREKDAQLFSIDQKQETAISDPLGKTKKNDVIDA